MKKLVIIVLILIIALSIFIICFHESCGLCGGRYKTKLFVNGEPTYVQLVGFYDNYVTIPMRDILLELGAKYIGDQDGNIRCLQLNNQYFIIDYRKYLVFLEDETGYLEYFQEDHTKNTDRWGESNSLLPSENIQDDQHYIHWHSDGRHVATKVTIDHNTLISILRKAGIELQADIDYKNEIIYLSSSPR